MEIATSSRAKTTPCLWSLALDADSGIRRLAAWAGNGVGLWAFETENGRSLRPAANLARRRWAGLEVQWPHPERGRAKTAGPYKVMRRGAWAWSNAEMDARAALHAMRHGDLGLNLRLPVCAR